MVSGSLVRWSTLSSSFAKSACFQPGICARKAATWTMCMCSMVHIIERLLLQNQKWPTLGLIEIVLKGLEQHLSKHLRILRSVTLCPNRLPWGLPSCCMQLYYARVGLLGQRRSSTLLVPGLLVRLWTLASSFAKSTCFQPGMRARKQPLAPCSRAAWFRTSKGCSSKTRNDPRLV